MKNIVNHMIFAVVSCGCVAGLVAARHGWADDFSDDVAAVRRFLDSDRSYDAEGRRRAEAELRSLEAEAGSMSAAAVQLAVARIAAIAQNGHTMLLPGPWARQFDRIPLRLQPFADGWHVIHAPESMSDLAGALVVSIDGHPTEEIEATFATYLGALETKRKHWIAFFAESPALLCAAGLTRRSDRIELQLELEDGAKVVRAVKATFDPPQDGPFDFFHRPRLVRFAQENVRGEMPLYLAEPDRFFRTAPLPELDAAYLQLRANTSQGDEKIEAFVEDALAWLRKAAPRNLIVDLRFDGGGDLTTTRELFETLPGVVPAGGCIFALTSGWTFSAGISSLGYLKMAGGSKVTIVGEPIGDRLEFWAEGDIVELPVSKATLLYATERHNYVTGCPESDCHGSVRSHPIRVPMLEPDILAPLSYGEYRAGRDPALEVVREQLARP